MIKKLMKYDLKNMFKILVIIYVVCLSLATLTRIINIGKDIQIIAIIGSIFSSLTYSAIAAVIINMFIHILVYFNHSFYKDESYLTHTLPISKNKLLISKYLSSLIVVISSLLVCLVSLGILFYSNSFIETIKYSIETALSGFNLPIWLIIFLLAITIFTQLFTSITMVFLSIIKANQYNHKRIMHGLIWFLGFYFITMITTLIVIAITFALSGNINYLFANQLSQTSLIIIIIIALIMNIVYNVLFYLLSKREFNKGVNVD